MEGLTAKEVARHLGITRQRVYFLKDKGILKLNKFNKFDLEQVESYKKSPKRKAGRPEGSYKKWK